MTFILSFGRWGGFYCHSHRLCLGYAALTVYVADFDPKLDAFMDWMETQGR